MKTTELIKRQLASILP